MFLFPACGNQYPYEYQDHQHTSQSGHSRHEGHIYADVDFLLINDVIKTGPWVIHSYTVDIGEDVRVLLQGNQWLGD